jgi:hypothetical protein
MALCILLFLVFAPPGRAQAPVFEIIPVQSWMKFHVKSSVTIAGKFDKWGATAHRGRITHRQLVSGESAVWACQRCQPRVGFCSAVGYLPNPEVHEQRTIWK